MVERKGEGTGVPGLGAAFLESSGGSMRWKRYADTQDGHSWIEYTMLF